jgi:hypothetical protein
MTDDPMEAMSDNSRTTQETRDPQEAEEATEKPRIELNLGRLAAGALAAVTAAALCSRLGVAGTLVGTGVISLVSGAASVIYQRSLERTRTVVSTTRQKITDNGLSMTRVLRVDHSPADDPTGTADQPTEQFAVTSEEPDTEPEQTGPRGVWASLRSYLHSPRRRWVIAGAGALLTFVVALGAVAGLELLRGESLSGQAHGTTVGAIFGGGGASNNQPAPAHPAPTTSSSTTPSPSGPGTPSHSHSPVPNSPAPTTTTSPTQTPSSSPTPTPSGQAPPTTAPSPTGSAPGAPAPTPTVTPSTR